MPLKRVAYTRRPFLAPNAYSVQEPLSGTEYHKHNAVTSCGADYRVINALITAIPSITAIRLREAIPYYGHALMEAAWDKKQRFAEKPLQLFRKTAVTFTQFFYICAE